MRMSFLVGRRHKEKPAEASLISHIYLLRGGYIRPVANGIYSLLPPTVRIQEKIESIIRTEMNAIEGQEVKMPVVLPRELWDETKRYDTVGSELLRLEDRTHHGMLLAMTHEEAAVHLARTETSSYKDFPFVLYQIQTKFRDEARSRGGLIRVREFTMKDAYSFHTFQADLDAYYDQCAEAYHRIFARCGIPEVLSIQSDNGMMGGKEAHEYMFVTSAGEDKIVSCDHCRYTANQEVASSLVASEPTGEALPLQRVETPKISSIPDLVQFFNLPPFCFAKSVFYKTSSGKLICCIIRGDIDINEIKLSKILKETFEFASDIEIQLTGAVPGFAGAVGLENCSVLVDKSAATATNLICGANKKDEHFKNFNVFRDIPSAKIVDIATVKEGDTCPHCGKGHITMKRGIEVGNIFKLGTFYTERMHMTYTNEEGNEKNPIMGCYGIGIGRLIGCIIEARHDDFGPIWPMSVSPWQVHLNVLQADKANALQIANNTYQEMERNGIEVLFDDRNLSAGTQFAEADLMGIPLRLILSPRNLGKGMVEYKVRGSQEQGFIPIVEIVSFCKKFIQQEMEKLNTPLL